MTIEPKCVLWKRMGAEYVQQQTEGMTIAEELEFWRKQEEYLKVQRQEIEERVSGQSLLSILQTYDGLDLSSGYSEAELAYLSNRSDESSSSSETPESQDRSEMLTKGVRLYSMSPQEEMSLPRLPDDVEAELEAMSNLLDETLWILARSTMSRKDQESLSILGQEAKIRSITYQEQEEYDRLLGLADRTMLRRAQAASLLMERGYDMSDPAVLQKPN